MYKRSRMSRGNPKDYQEPTHPFIKYRLWSVESIQKKKEKKETYPPYLTLYPVYTRQVDPTHPDTNRVPFMSTKTECGM